MWQRFSFDSKRMVLRAQEIAAERKQKNVSAPHFVLAALEAATGDSKLGELLLSAGLKREEVQLYLEAALEEETDAAFEGTPLLSGTTKRAIQVTAANRQIALVEPAHLLLECLDPRFEPSLVATLTSLGWDLAALRDKQRELDAHLYPSSPSTPLDALTDNSKKIVDAAYAAMRATWCGHISTAHLLLGVLEDERVRELVAEVGASPDELKARTRAQIRSDSRLATPAKRFDQGAKRALYRAQRCAHSCGHKFIGPEHILLGLLPRRATLREMIQLGLNVPDQAAPLLVELDASKLRALVIPATSKSAPRPQKTSVDVPRRAIAPTFFLMFVAGATSALALTRAPRNPSPLEVAGLLVFVSLLFSTGFGSCWMLLASHKPNLKSAWSAAFGGFLIGTILTVSLFGH